VHVVAATEAYDSPTAAGLSDIISAPVFARSSRAAFAQAGLSPADVDHLMIYDAFAHLPLFGLEALGFVKPGEAADFVADWQTAPGGTLPLNTNGGGLSYTHTGMYGMFAIQESVRQLRGEAAAQLEGVETSFVQGVGGGTFTAGASLVLTRD
jgi:acetyl-CoA acetyltransferase